MDKNTPVIEILTDYERRLRRLESVPQLPLPLQLLSYAVGAFFGTAVGVLIGRVLFG